MHSRAGPRAIMKPKHDRPLPDGSVRTPACAASKDATTPWSKSCAGPSPAASSPPTATAPLKACAFWKKPFAAACAFGPSSSASRRRPGPNGCCPNSAPRSRPSCCPTSYLPAPSPAKRLRAWLRWCAGRNSPSKMFWPSLRPDRCWPLPECRTPEIWGQSCARPRLSAPAACCWAKARSAHSIPKSCVLRQVRFSGCPWRGRNCPTLSAA